ncbi:hypothetical protein A2U01_0042873 [Trifolium medium]|uniref:Uncharacterized protein n=1 Tax=Trifolium medium TaxID=97028 RepID=A0A392QC32_9FABA|nr:hypothetical protein [Trifolium medium]
MLQKIAELERKIADEKAKQKYLESKTVEISQEEINKEARDGIEHYSSAKVMDDAIIRLNEENEVLAEKMNVTRELYDKLRTPLLKKSN